LTSKRCGGCAWRTGIASCRHLGTLGSRPTDCGYRCWHGGSVAAIDSFARERRMSAGARTRRGVSRHVGAMSSTGDTILEALATYAHRYLNRVSIAAAVHGSVASMQHTAKIVVGNASIYRSYPFALVAIAHAKPAQWGGGDEKDFARQRRRCCRTYDHC